MAEQEPKNTYLASSYEEALDLMSFEIDDYMNVPKNSKFANFLANNLSRKIRFSLSDDVPEVQWKHPKITVYPDRGIGYGLFVAQNPNSIFSLDKNFSTSLSKTNDPSLEAKVANFFKTRRIILPSNSSVDTVYKNFEGYTSVGEEHHLSRWACVALKFLSEGDTRIGKEVQLLEESNPRDGRLDVCAISDNKLLILESKIGIQAALADNRFRYRIPSYFSETAKIIKTNVSPMRHMVVLLIGGSELPLFPKEHLDYQESAYQLGSSFLNRCIESNITLITANFLWCSLMKSLVSGNIMSWNNVMWKELSKTDTLGLTSAGRLKKDGTIEALNFNL